MRNLIPAASACFVVAMIATVGYAESQLDPVGDAEFGERAAASDSRVVDGSSNPQGQRDAVPNDFPQAAPKELSAAPLNHVTYPEDRPAWIDAGPDLDSPVHTWVVSTGGCESMQMCEDKLDALITAEVAMYIKRSTGWECNEAFLDDQWIEKELIGRRYVGTLQQGDQVLHEVALELRFDRASRNRIHDAMENGIVRERLQAAGGLFAIALLGLCVTGGLLGLSSRHFT